MANFHVDTSGNLWLGVTSTTFSESAPFYVKANGDVRANSIDLTIQEEDDADGGGGGNKRIDLGSSGSKIYDFGGDIFINASDDVVVKDVLRLAETSGSVSEPTLLFGSSSASSGSQQNPVAGLTSRLVSADTHGGNSNHLARQLEVTNGSTYVMRFNSVNDEVNIPGDIKLATSSDIYIGTDAGSNGEVLMKSGGDIVWGTVSGGGSHSDSDHTSFYSQSAGEALASAISSHTGHATSLSLLSNTSSDDSAGLFVTSVSGFGIRRTNRAGTTLLSQHLYPKNSHSSWGGIYDIGASPVQAYDDAYIGTVNENSDVNIKENIVDVDLGLDFINALTPKKYKLKDFDYENDEGETVSKTHTRTHYGLIAQDVKEVLKSIHPDDYTNDAMFTHLPNDDGEFVGEDSEFDGWALRYRQLIAPLVKAVQELSTQVSDLTARIETLEG